jgi:hypothetical protein
MALPSDGGFDDTEGDQAEPKIDRQAYIGFERSVAGGGRKVRHE